MTIYILQGEELDETGENGIIYIYGIFDNQELAKKERARTQSSAASERFKRKGIGRTYLMNRTK